MCTPHTTRKQTQSQADHTTNKHKITHVGTNHLGSSSKPPSLQAGPLHLTAGSRAPRRRLRLPKTATQPSKWNSGDIWWRNSFVVADAVVWSSNPFGLLRRFCRRASHSGWWPTQAQSLHHVTTSLAHVIRLAYAFACNESQLNLLRCQSLRVKHHFVCKHSLKA